MSSVFLFFFLFMPHYPMTVQGHNLTENSSVTRNDCQSAQYPTSYHRISIYLFVALMIIALCVCLVQVILDFRLRYIPDSILFVVVGAALGFLIRLIHSLKFTPSSTENFTPALLFLIIIPPIIFDSGYNLNKANFFRNFGSILVFAIIGTLISSIVTGLGLFLLGGAGLSFQLSLRESLAFGALISAIDPVATLAVFSAMDVDKVLYMLVFGESILNDAVAITLLNTVSVVLDESNVGMSQGWQLVLHAAKAFLAQFLGSAVVGCGMSLLAAMLLKCVNFRKFPSLEVALVMIFSYAPYCLADGINLSGIVALLFAGITMSNYAHLNLSPVTQITVQQTIRTVALIAEMCTFLYLGFAIFTFKLRLALGLVTWTILLCFMGRAFNIFPLAAVLNLFRSRKIPKDTQIVMWFSGIRGAIPFALALSLDFEEETKEYLVSTTLVVVLFSILFLGGSAMPFVKFVQRLKLTIEKPSVENVQRHPLFINWSKVRDISNVFPSDCADQSIDNSNEKANLSKFHAHYLLPIFTRQFTPKEIRNSWRAMTNLTDHWYSAVRSTEEDNEESLLDESDLPEPIKIEPAVVNIGQDFALKATSEVFSVQPSLRQDLS